LGWCGPDDQWPRHGRDYFRKALDYARAARWWLDAFDGHSFGKVVCDKSLPQGDRCEFLIFSSGSGSESNALELRSIVDRCPHRGDPSKSSVDVAKEYLHSADLLIEAAQACMTAEDRRARADELLAVASEQAEAAEEVLDQALDLDSDAEDAFRTARDLADSAGYPSEEPVDPEPLLDAAEARTSLAGEKLSRPGKSRARDRVRERVAATQAKIQALRDQLGGPQSVTEESVT